MMDELLLLYGCDESAYRQGVEQLVWSEQPEAEPTPPQILQVKLNIVQQFNS